MPAPKITGLLNNCALNSALPSLLLGISRLAAEENLEPLAPDPVFQSYQMLKDQFAGYYGVNPSAFNWQDFDAFLKAHSFYAQEMLLAPVFRGFIAEKGKGNDYHEPDLWLLRDVQEGGRYNPLTYQEAAKLFHAHFGLSLQQYVFIEDKHTADCSDNYQSNSEPTPVIHSSAFFGGVGVINLYLKGQDFDCVGHFELLPHESLEEATKAYLKEIEELPRKLREIHDGLSGSDRAILSNRALGLLAHYVHEALKTQKKTQRWQTEYMLSAERYAEVGRSIHFDTPEGNQTFAVLLLSILFESKHSRAQYFLEQMEGLAVLAEKGGPSPSSVLKNLCEAIITEKANLEAERVLTILSQAEDYLFNNQPDALKPQSPEPQNVQNLEEAAGRLISEANRLQNETDAPLLQGVINETTHLVECVNNGNLTPEILENYRQKSNQVSLESGWGRIIAGLMLSVLGLALIALSALSLSGTLGLAAAPALPTVAAGVASLTAGVGCVYAGIRFFSSGVGKEPKDNAENKSFRPHQAMSV